MDNISTTDNPMNFVGYNIYLHNRIIFPILAYYGFSSIISHINSHKAQSGAQVPYLIEYSIFLPVIGRYSKCTMDNNYIPKHIYQRATQNHVQPSDYTTIWAATST